MVLFILSEIINLKNQVKTGRNRKFPSLIEFQASLTKQPKAAHTCYLHSLHPYPCPLNILS